MIAGSSGEKICLVEALPEDEATLWLMLTFAASMGSGGEAAIEKARSDADLRGYVEGWGSRVGDVGIIARLETGQSLGAAWLRLIEKGGPFKVGDCRIPELATALLPGARGRGVGTLMLRRLIEVAQDHFPAIVLSVREGNPAVHLYSRLGFQQTGRMENRTGGSSLVMRLDLRAAAKQRI